MFPTSKHGWVPANNDLRHHRLLTMGFSENTGITGLNNEKQARSKEIILRHQTVQQTLHYRVVFPATARLG